MLLIPFKTYTMITGTLSLSSGQALLSGTHPSVLSIKNFKIMNNLLSQ